MKYQIHKGVGKSVEFKGLKSQYLLIFAVGLLSIFFVVIVLFMVGVNNLFCIVFGLIATSVLVWLTFKLNRQYGEHGLIKLFANKHRPRFLINRKLIHHFIKQNHAEYTKSDNARK